MTAQVLWQANDDIFKRKIGAAVVVARRAGSIHVYDTINHFFIINQMIIPGADCWRIGIGLNKRDVESDEEAKQTMKTLGHNMA
ncbi:MAG: hypothetical protein ACLFMM_00845 [Methanohalobium sp.]|uniref:hypothetical protein n=1 Tax=Methanohalobium sp. TaxID=2837493 RepID=UPI00397CC536